MLSVCIELISTNDYHQMNACCGTSVTSSINIQALTFSSLKAWRSLRILDTIVNSILGRSGGSSGMQFDSRLDSLWSTIAHARSHFIREKAVQAAFDLCPFMDELEKKGPVQDPAFTEDFLKRLQSWSKALPHGLRSSTDVFAASSDSTCRESFVGAAHVACMYAFSQHRACSLDSLRKP